MKKLLAPLALLPGQAIAHGAHAPVPETMHGFAHVVPGVFAAALLVVVVLLWRARQ